MFLAYLILTTTYFVYLGALTMVKILIVDDQLSSLISLEEILKGIPDIEILKSNSAKSALKMMIEHNVECILLDVSMPEMDGFEFLNTLQMAPAHANIPVIMVTGKVFSDNEALRAYQCGAVDFLFKPLDPQVVYRKVGFFVTQAKRAKSLSAIQSNLDNPEELVIKPLSEACNSIQVENRDLFAPILNQLEGLNEVWKKYNPSDKKLSL